MIRILQVVQATVLLTAVGAILTPRAFAADPKLPTFAPRVDYATPGYTQSVAVGDLNRDGIPDVVGGNSEGGNSVSVFLGLGFGPLGPRVDYPIVSDVRDVVLGDLNRDGILDIIAINRTGALTGNLSVLLGKGNGTFYGHVEYEMAPYGSAGVVIDVDRDGKLDVVACGVQNLVSVLRGDGLGKLGAHFDYPAGANQFTVGDIAVGDLNTDGRPDFVTANGFDFSISVLPRSKVGVTLGPKVDYFTNDFTYSVAIGDLNHDGRADIVAGKGGAVSVFYGSGTGAFSNRVEYAFPQAISARAMAVADINLDGRNDIVISGSGEVLLLLGTPEGFVNRIASSGNLPQYGMVVADVNRDSKPDIVFTNERFVHILMNTTSP
jgi:hypothetical protein